MHRFAAKQSSLAVLAAMRKARTSRTASIARRWLSSEKMASLGDTVAVHYKFSTVL
jgi:hypothetical protein